MWSAGLLELSVSRATIRGGRWNVSNFLPSLQVLFPSMHFMIVIFLSYSGLCRSWLQYFRRAGLPGASDSKAPFCGDRWKVGNFLVHFQFPFLSIYCMRNKFHSYSGQCRSCLQYCRRAGISGASEAIVAACYFVCILCMITCSRPQSFSRS